MKQTTKFTLLEKNYFSSMLQKYLEQTELTNKQFAELMNCPVYRIGNWLEPTALCRRPTDEEYERLATLLTIDVDCLKRPSLGSLNTYFDKIAQETPPPERALGRQDNRRITENYLHNEVTLLFMNADRL